MKDNFKQIISSQQMIPNIVREINEFITEHGYCTVEIKKGTRSLSQNALYWMWLTEVADFVNMKKGTDFKPEELHDKFRHEYLGYEDAKVIGSTHIPMQLRTTTKLTKGEMFHYLNQIDQHWAGLGLLLTTPSDSQYAQMKESQYV